jgi:hypothetical protein
MPTPPSLIPRYLALFFLSAYTMGLAVLLFRFFAVAVWPEYGVGVLVVALTGLAFGAAAPVCRIEFWQRNRQAVLFWLPFVLLFVSALSFQGIALVRFNPVLLGHEAFRVAQLWHLLCYCLILWPVFFLAGLLIGLSFLDLSRNTAAVTVHLLGLATGLVSVFFFQYYLHPFYLPAALLPVLALAILPRLFPLRYGLFLTGLILLFFLTGFGVWRIVDGKMVRIPEYKALAAAMQAEGNRVTGELLTPQGAYTILDNFTERHNIDLSGQYGFPRVAVKPIARGLYRDGDRVTGLYRGGQPDFAYFTASLDQLPYLLRPEGKYLLLGTDGGFKIHELWGAKRTLTAVEPTPVLYDLTAKQIGGMKNVHLVCNSPLAVLEPKGFDVIDLGNGLLDEGDANRYTMTVDALAHMIVSLKDGGVLSLPVATGHFSGYAMKVLATVNAALQRMGVKDPGKQILVYRSVLHARILVFRRAISAAEVDAFLLFCRERAFDVSWYPGIAPLKLATLYDLPAGSLTNPAPNRTEEPSDALRDGALNLFRNPGAVLPSAASHLQPATLDRPFFYGIVPWKQLWSGWSLPRTEVGPWIYILALMAVLVLGLCAVAAVAGQGSGGGALCLRTGVYFACLGGVFALITQALSERGAYFLGEGTAAFYLVLSGILFFAGWGSFRARRFDPASDRGIKWAVLRIILCLMLYVFLLTPALSLLLPLSGGIKMVAVLLVVSPVAYAMGAPLSLGFASLTGSSDRTVPCALGFFLLFFVATAPLGKLIALVWGVHALIFAAVILTFTSLWAYPGVPVMVAPKRS